MSVYVIKTVKAITSINSSLIKIFKKRQSQKYERDFRKYLRRENEKSAIKVFVDLLIRAHF